MLAQLGGLLGWGIFIFYGLALTHFFFRIINTRFKEQLKNYPRFKKIYQQVMKFLIKNHYNFGSIAVVLIFLHLTIQWYTNGLLLTGIMAALLILTEVILGIVGAAKKWKTNKIWLGFHLVTGFLIVVAVLVHLLIK